MSKLRKRKSREDKSKEVSQTAARKKAQETKRCKIKQSHSESRITLQICEQARKDKTIASCLNLVSDEHKEIVKTTLDTAKNATDEMAFSVFADSLVKIYQKKNPETSIKLQDNGNPEVKKDGKGDSVVMADYEAMKASDKAGEDYYAALDAARKR